MTTPNPNPNPNPTAGQPVDPVAMVQALPESYLRDVVIWVLQAHVLRGCEGCEQRFIAALKETYEMFEFNSRTVNHSQYPEWLVSNEGEK